MFTTLPTQSMISKLTPSAMGRSSATIAITIPTVSKTDAAVCLI